MEKLKLTNVGDPEDLQDAATRGYVEKVASHTEEEDDEGRRHLDFKKQRLTHIGSAVEDDDAITKGQVEEMSIVLKNPLNPKYPRGYMDAKGLPISFVSPGKTFTDVVNMFQLFSQLGVATFSFFSNNLNKEKTHAVLQYGKTHYRLPVTPYNIKVTHLYPATGWMVYINRKRLTEGSVNVFRRNVQYKVSFRPETPGQAPPGGLRCELVVSFRMTNSATEFFDFPEPKEDNEAGSVAGPHSVIRLGEYDEQVDDDEEEEVVDSPADDDYPINPFTVSFSPVADS